MTIVATMSASGHILAPAFIFPRERIKSELMDNAPNGSLALSHRTKDGWIVTYFWFMKYFVEQTKPSKERSILIILDGHCSPVRIQKV